MKYILLFLFFSVTNYLFAQDNVPYYYEQTEAEQAPDTDSDVNTEKSGVSTPDLKELGTENVGVFSQITNAEDPIPEPPVLAPLPDLNTISEILNISNTLEDIKGQFDQIQLEYTGAQVFNPDQNMQGIWWRFYTQDTGLFGIPGVSEELLVIEQNGKAIWIQNVKTTETVRAKSQRLLNISQYNLFGYDFFVFHYADQDPASQKIRDCQGFFVRMLPDQGYFQMSKSPNFEPDQSIYWKRFPTVEN